LSPSAVPRIPSASPVSPKAVPTAPPPSAAMARQPTAPAAAQLRPLPKEQMDLIIQVFAPELPN
ncbi:MAG: hypothetical protein WBR56_16175, partial [Sedimenticolaceae bacterium]